MKKFQIITGLVLLAAMMAITGGINDVNAKLLIGGDWSPGGDCCDGSELDGCDQGVDSNGAYPCAGDNTNICLTVTDPDAPGECEINTVCVQRCTYRGEEFGEDICTTTWDTDCTNDQRQCPPDPA